MWDKHQSRLVIVVFVELNSSDTLFICPGTSFGSRECLKQPVGVFVYNPEPSLSSESPFESTAYPVTNHRCDDLSIVFCFPLLEH